MTKEEQDAMRDDNKCFIDEAKQGFIKDAIDILIVILAVDFMLIGLFIVEIARL